MTTLEVNMATPKLQQQQLIEHYWQSALDQLNRGSSEVVLPLSIASSIGQPGITAIADRFSAFINAHASVLHDPSLDVIRILPPPQGHAGSQMSSSGSPTLSNTSLTASSQPADARSCANAKAKVAKDRMSKVPRPPNAFILYRQHHHPLVKQNNPGLHNNQISVIIGKQWKNEDEETQTFFKKRADDVKRKHFEDHPEYQYQPRKPSARKRRMTKNKAAKIAEATTASNLPATLLPSTQTHGIDSQSPPDSNFNIAPVTFANSNVAPATAVNPLLTQFVPQVEVVPEFQISSDGLLIIHDFSADQSAMFQQMIEQYNSQTNAPTWPPGTFPDVLLSEQTDEAAGDQAYHEAQIDYVELEAEIKATNGERDAAFRAQYPDVDLNASLYTTVEEYDEMWLQWSKNEDQRMTELELEFGTGPHGDYCFDLFDIPTDLDNYGISDISNSKM